MSGLIRTTSAVQPSCFRAISISFRQCSFATSRVAESVKDGSSLHIRRRSRLRQHSCITLHDSRYAEQKQFDQADQNQGSEFVRRWCLHILPKGYAKSRRFGGYSGRHRQRYITECRELLGSVPAEPAAALWSVCDRATCGRPEDSACFPAAFGDLRSEVVQGHRRSQTGAQQESCWVR